MITDSENVTFRHLNFFSAKINQANIQPTLTNINQKHIIDGTRSVAGGNNNTDDVRIKAHKISKYYSESKTFTYNKKMTRNKRSTAANPHRFAILNKAINCIDRPTNKRFT